MLVGHSFVLVSVGYLVHEVSESDEGEDDFEFFVDAHTGILMSRVSGGMRRYVCARPFSCGTNATS